MALIVILYALYPFIYSHILKRKTSVSVVLCVVASLFVYGMAFLLDRKMGTNVHQWYKGVEIAITRFPIFFLGCCIGPLAYEHKKINKWVLLTSLLSLAYGLYFCYYPIGLVKHYRIPLFFYGFGLTIWTAILFLIFNELQMIMGGLRFLGERSLELYLIHIVLRHVTIDMGIYGTNRAHNYAVYLVAVVLSSIIISIPIHYLANLIMKKILSRVKIKSMVLGK